MNFTRVKKWGMVIGKKVDTTITKNVDGIVICQKTIKAFGTDNVIDTGIRFDMLASVNTHLDINNWDIMLAILAGVIGSFGAPYLFLVSALLIWRGYGHEIVIRTKEGVVYKIPYDKRDGDVDELLKALAEKPQNINGKNKEEYAFEEKDEKNNVREIILNSGETSQKIFCRECGKELKKEWKLCPECGTSVIYNTDKK